MDAPVRRPPWPLLAVILIWGGLAAIYLFGARDFNDPDAYYHVRLSALMLREGLFLDSLPQVTESTWSDRFFDKEWLFHVYLIPFLAAGLTVGPKLAALGLNVLIVLGLWQACRALRVRAPAWWLLVLPFCGDTVFWNRLTLVRPHLGSIAILFFCLAAIVLRQRLLLAALSLVYALAYTGHWQLLGIVLIYDVLYALLDDDGRRRPAWCRQLPMLIPAAAGMLLGELIHPQFPDNLHGLFMQNVMVLKEYWHGQVSPALIAARPAEIRPYGLGEFFARHALIVAGLLAIGLHAWRSRERLARQEWMLAAFVGVYLLMASRSQRFSEYLVAMAVVFMAVYWERHRLGLLFARGSRWWRVAAAGMLAVFVLTIAVRRYLQVADRRERLHNEHPFAGAAAWIDAHLAAGEIVFATSWSDNPYLFYGAPRQRYLVFLDPYFMYARSPARFELWNDIRYARVEDPAGVVRQEFGASAIFTQPFFTDLVKRLDATPGVALVYIGPRGERLYQLPANWPPESATPSEAPGAEPGGAPRQSVRPGS